MNLYRNVTVNAQLSSDLIGTAASLSGNITSAANVNGNVSAQADMINKTEVNYVSNYNLLQNKPQINSVELIGNKALPDIGVDTISNIELENLLT